jgi:hypothetical protein
MLQLFQFLAVLCSGLFAGAAVYINVAEHPARLLLDDGAALRQWAPSYGRATLMQAPLALAGFIAGVAAWVSSGGLVWLIAAVLIGVVVPFTLIVIKPINDKLLAELARPAGAPVRQMLGTWGRLHAVRSTLSLAAFLMMLAAR